MLRFLRDRRPGVLLATILASLFILMAIQVRRGTGAGSEGFLLRLASPFIRASAAITGGLSGAWSDYVSLRGASDRNKTLERDITALRLELHELEEARLENERLMRLLDLKEGIGAPSLAARVIGNKSAGLSRTILIDRGTADGLTPNMPVVAAEGVVGRVWTTSPRVSKVQLITDAEAGTGVLIQRTRVQGILFGRGTEVCTMEFVSQIDEVQEGDLLVTNGLDGIYPKGLPVGPVVKLGRGQGVLRTITVDPRVKFNRLEEVLVLLTSRIDLPGVADGAQP